MVIREEDEQWGVPQLVGRPICHLSQMGLQIVAVVAAHGLRTSQVREPTFRRGYQRSVIDYILMDVRLWSSLVDMEVRSTTDSDHYPLAILLNGGNFVRSSNWGLLALPELNISNDLRRVTWTRVLANQEAHAEIYQWFVQLLDDFEDLHEDSNLFSQTHSLLFDKVKLIFSREYRGSQRSGAKHPHRFNRDCRMTRRVLITAIRECNRAAIKCA
ncbi:hypothetical protein NDU88_003673 [Pleurodeles waltl]|uniref:Endonuclease/exonuclease/phosphatase domain-containing protein n=1 Tax=Pleurodeles waltl TaxID=8319 RepID=A0AAV7REK9_PLEWA|nr:hypothetical protein NDU88_003673 [Pleurodeles waltl]